MLTNERASLAKLLVAAIEASGDILECWLQLQDVPIGRHRPSKLPLLAVQLRQPLHHTVVLFTVLLAERKPIVRTSMYPLVVRLGEEVTSIERVSFLEHSRSLSRWQFRGRSTKRHETMDIR